MSVLGDLVGVLCDLVCFFFFRLPCISELVCHGTSDILDMALNPQV